MPSDFKGHFYYTGLYTVHFAYAKDYGYTDTHNLRRRCRTQSTGMPILNWYCGILTHGEDNFVLAPALY